MRALPPPPIIYTLTALAAFERRASAHFLRRPRTGKIATSAITRISAEKATQRNGSVWLYEGAAHAMISSGAVMPVLYIGSSAPSKEHCDFR